MIEREEALEKLKEGVEDWKVINQIFDEIEERLCCFCLKREKCNIFISITDPMITMNEVNEFSKEYGCNFFEKDNS